MLISIDWLQLHCVGVLNYPSSWRVERQNYSTRQFKYIDEIYFGGAHFATIVHTPLSTILPPDMSLIKIANERLYEPSMFPCLQEMLQVLRLTVKGISRLDLACDFNEFHNHLNPANLIKRFFTCDYRKVGQTKFKAQGQQKRNVEFDYLRFGTNNSLCSAYLYNKTKELNEVKMKSYIVDTWRASGLDTDKDVWRLEFSMKGNQIKFANEKSGEFHGFNLDLLQDNNYLISCYLGLVDSYFRFKKSDKQKNVSRMRDLVLFGGEFLKYKRFIFRECGDGTRADKIFIKKLESVNNELRSIKSELKTASEGLLLQYITAKGLSSYYLNKVQGALYNEVKMLQKLELTFEQHQDKINSTLQENKEDTERNYNKFYFNHKQLNSRENESINH